MNLPSVIVFDLGKVLVDFDYSIAARRIAVRCPKKVDYARFFDDHASLMRDYELGKLTTQQFCEAIRAASGFTGTTAEFGEFFADIFEPMPPMVELHAAVRQRKFPTWIFSNTNDLAVSHIRNRYSFFRGFDGYVLSYEHGGMKPEPKLYEVVERETGRRGAEILYLDDRPENIETGIARGWQAVLHETPEKTRGAFARIGVLA